MNHIACNALGYVCMYILRGEEVLRIEKKSFEWGIYAMLIITFVHRRF